MHTYFMYGVFRPPLTLLSHLMKDSKKSNFTYKNEAYHARDLKPN